MPIIMTVLPGEGWGNAREPRSHPPEPGLELVGVVDLTAYLDPHDSARFLTINIIQAMSKEDDTAVT